MRSLWWSRKPKFQVTQVFCQYEDDTDNTTALNNDLDNDPDCKCCPFVLRVPAVSIYKCLRVHDLNLPVV